MVVVAVTLHDPGTHEALQPLGQGVGGNALFRFQELGEAALAAHQVAHDEQRPAVAEHIERA